MSPPPGADRWRHLQALPARIVAPPGRSGGEGQPAPAVPVPASSPGDARSQAPTGRFYPPWRTGGGGGAGGEEEEETGHKPRPAAREIPQPGRSGMGDVRGKRQRREFGGKGEGQRGKRWSCGSLKFLPELVVTEEMALHPAAPPRPGSPCPGSRGEQCFEYF